jgi:hypothetical protein
LDLRDFDFFEGNFIGIYGTKKTLKVSHHHSSYIYIHTLSHTLRDVERLERIIVTNDRLCEYEDASIYLGK